jgi:uncharacterized tellurite resistance protein B-like protein
MNVDRELDARSAAVIAAGMMAVALADGEAHPREVEMIEAFRKELPEGVDPSGVVLEDPWEREVFVRSLLMVAVADGAVSDDEGKVIEELARAHGVSEEQLEGIRREVAMQMAYTLAGEELPES